MVGLCCLAREAEQRRHRHVLLGPRRAPLVGEEVRVDVPVRKADGKGVLPLVGAETPCGT